MKNHPRKLRLIGIFMMLTPLALIGLIYGTVADAARGQSEIMHSAPTVDTTLFAMKDTYVASGKPNDNWATGKAIWTGNSNSGFGIQRSLIGFDLSGIPDDSTIQSANLTLHVGGTTTNDEDMAVIVQRVNGAWAETVTWATRPTDVDAEHGVAVMIPAIDDRNYNWAITELIQKWINEDATSRGTLLSLLITGNETSGTHERAFWSKDCVDADCGASPGKRPRLTISYSAPAVSPLPAESPTPVASPTPAASPTPSPTPVANVGLAIRTKPSDPRGTAIFPGESIDIDVIVQNGPIAVSSVELSSTFPSGFIQATGDPNMEPNMIMWTLGMLAASGRYTRSYTITRPSTSGISGSVDFEDSASPPSTTRPGQETPFSVSQNSGTGYCYRWDFGDDTAYELLDVPTLIHVYDSSGTYPVEVTVSRGTDFFAKASTEITVAGDVANDQAPSYRSNCSVNERSGGAGGLQNVFIAAEVMWSSDAESKTKSSSILVKPSNRQYFPLMQ